MGKSNTTPVDLPNDIRSALHRLRGLNAKHELLQFADLKADYLDHEDPVSIEFSERYSEGAAMGEDQPLVEYLAEIEDALAEECEAAGVENKASETSTLVLT